MKKLSREQRKARVIAKAEELIDELLEGDDQTKRPNLDAFQFVGRSF